MIHTHKGLLALKMADHTLYDNGTLTVMAIFGFWEKLDKVEGRWNPKFHILRQTLIPDIPSVSV